MASIKKEFTSTTTSEEIVVQEGSFDIEGTYEGTIQIQQKIVDEWVPIATYTDAETAIGDETAFDVGGRMPMRFQCTDYTSGTAICRMDGR